MNINLNHTVLTGRPARALSGLKSLLLAAFILGSLSRAALAAPGDITTVAGGGPNRPGDGGAATTATLNTPFGVTIDSAGNLFIADYLSNSIRRVDATTKVISTVAGTGNQSFSGDGGLATAAALNRPFGVAVDGAGNLFISDNGNSRIRRVDATTKVITTVAGTGNRGFGGDGGRATAALISGPDGLSTDSAGNFYFADGSNSRVRRVDAATNIITTVAGNGNAGFSGDGGAATAATLNSPSDAFVDSAGNLFIADYVNNRVRRVDATTKVISTVAGNGNPGFGGDGGRATFAALNSPSDVTTDSAGNLFIADHTNNRVRRVDATTNIISTVAGTGVAGFSGDGGPATAAMLNSTDGVAVDSAGNLFINDSGNNRIRKVDAFPQLSINDVSVNEGNSGTATMTFTVTRSGDTSSASSVDYTTNGVTAKAGSDYAANSGTLNFAAAQTTATIGITINGDQGLEPNETFNLTLSNAVGAIISKATGIGTITNDDSGLIVTTISDASTANDNDNSLREAITFANSNAGADTITFNIPGAGVQTIQLVSSLPTLTDAGTTINGYTQSDASVNTSATSDNAVIRIEVKGIGTGTGSFTGFNITTANCTISGLSILSCNNGVFINGFNGTPNNPVSGNTLAGNFIGVTANGSAALANGTGIRISSAPSNIIGGTTVAERNVISGNTGNGVTIIGNAATGNKVAGNFIGTVANGNAALANSTGVNIQIAANNSVGGTTVGERNVISGNTNTAVFISTTTGTVVTGNYLGTNAVGNAALANQFGVFIQDGPNNTIGGTTAGARNVISGNSNTGIAISAIDTSNGNLATGNNVTGNFIGTAADGTTALANNYGVVFDSAQGNTLGGVAAGAGNVISGNTSVGVIVSGVAATGNAIRGNSISANGALGIDLFNGTTPDGVTLNDAGDGDSGANGLQNFPALTSASGGNGNAVIKGTLNSTAGATFTIDFYDNAAADSSGYGQGQTYLGSQTVTTTGNDVAFTATLSGATVGHFISASATDAGGNTSEFSLARQIVANTAPTLEKGVFSASVNQAFSYPIVGKDADAGDTLTYAKTGTDVLPGNVTVASDGTVSGTPDATGTYAFNVTVTDSQGATATAWLHA